LENLKQTIAVLFRRKGKSSMTEKEFVFSASIDMRWFTPRTAQQLLDLALRLNLLKKTDSEISPNFDIEEIEVPLEFKPTEDILEVKPENLLSKLIGRLESSGIERKELVARINEIQHDYGLEPEVAALMLGNNLGVDIKQYIPEVEDIVKQRAKD
jgi:hypothetical protein